MSDPYSQPPGQPDPTQPSYPPPGGGYGPPAPTSGGYGQPAPTSGGYGQPAPTSGGYGQPAPTSGGYGQPAYGAPGGAPQYGQPAYATGVQQPAKSKKGLIIGLVVGVLVLLMIICGVGVALVLGSEDDPSTPTTLESGTPAASSSPTKAKPNNNAVTADSSSDFENVCEGGAILNAPEFGAPASAKAYVFGNGPDRKTSWSSKYLDSRASYYAKSADYATVSVVGCLEYEEGSEGTPLKCDIKASDGKQLTVEYISLRFNLTFFSAKTGEKIGDGGAINAPATKCPSVISYNKTTLKSYASPDTASIDAAVKKFLS